MPHGPSRIPGKGRCIYCGARDVELTDEHFIPLSLGGTHIIEDASCLACADITKRFEQDVARKMWGDARIAYDAPSRRKRSRPTHIKLRDPDNWHRTVKVPYKDYPAPMIFYLMHKAGFLTGAPKDLDTSATWQFRAVMDNEKAQNFEAKHGIKLTAQLMHLPDSFCRLLEKIGYGHVLWGLEPDDFDPICLPYMFGSKPNHSYIVGGSSDIPPPYAEFGYHVSTAAFGDHKRLILVADIRLYSNLHTPLYHVVVGEVRGQDNVARVVKKLEPGEITIANISDVQSSAEHWSPLRWPLPELA